jgi:hypothetical protein
MGVPALDRCVPPQSATLQVACTRYELRAQDPRVLNTLAKLTGKYPGTSQPGFTLNVSVIDAPEALEPAHFRGMEHLVTAILGANSFVFDLHRRQVHASVTAGVASDAELWSRRLFPLLLGVLGCSIDLLALHSACVVRNGQGILICGESMAGKSTLSVAVAQQGFELLSDDWTYIRCESSQLIASGLDVPVKLLPDAIRHFPELGSTKPQRSLNGEIAFEVSAQSMLKVQVTRTCLPTAIVFLERAEEGEPGFVRESGSFIQQYINNSVERLPQELRAAEAVRQRLVDAVSKLPAWRYRYSGSPQSGASALARFFE